MALKQFKPMTPGQPRPGSGRSRPPVEGRSERSLTEGLRSKGGRNNMGGSRRGGAAADTSGAIAWSTSSAPSSTWGTVERLEYDPNRTAFIALIRYEDSEHAYIMAPQRLRPAIRWCPGSDVDIRPGNAMPLQSMPVGTIVHNVEMKAGKGGQIARSAGTYVQLVGKDRGYALLRLTSGELRIVRAECMATIGAVSNADQQNIKLGKAGRSRWLGKRPSVRGVAMNPVDHPHGGGEGRTSGGRHPVTPWGKPTKGKRTRKQQADGRVDHASSSQEVEEDGRGTFRLEGSFCGRLPFQEGRDCARLRPQ